MFRPENFNSHANFKSQEQCERQGQRSQDRKRNESRRKKRYETSRLKRVTTHAAPFAVSLSVKLLCDGSRILWNRNRQESGGLVLLVIQTLTGISILYFLYSILEAKSAVEYQGNQNAFLMKSTSLIKSGGIGGKASIARARDTAVLIEKLQEIASVLFGDGDSVNTLTERLSGNFQETYRMLCWLCKVVGVEELKSMQHQKMIEKVEEIEDQLGIVK